MHRSSPWMAATVEPLRTFATEARELIVDIVRDPPVWRWLAVLLLADLVVVASRAGGKWGFFELDGVAGWLAAAGAPLSTAKIVALSVCIGLAWRATHRADYLALTVVAVVAAVESFFKFHLQVVPVIGAVLMPDAVPWQLARVVAGVVYFGLLAALTAGLLIWARRRSAAPPGAAWGLMAGSLLLAGIAIVGIDRLGLVAHFLVPALHKTLLRAELALELGLLSCLLALHIGIYRALLRGARS